MSDFTNDDPSGEGQLESLLGAVGMSVFSPEAQAEVERLLAPGQSLEPDVRHKLIESARRGTRHAAALRAPIERLLFELRRERDLSLDEVAVTTAVETDALRAIERGRHSIRTISPDAIARWVVAVDAELEPSIEALRSSLRRTSPEAVYAGRSDAPLSTDDERIVEQVQAALAEIVGGTDA